MAAARPPALAQAPVHTPTAPATLAPAQAQQALDVLRDDKRRAELITTLEAIATTTPQPPTAALPLTPDSLGAQLIVQVSAALDEAGSELVASLRAVNDLPLLWRWLASQADNPDARARVLDATWKLAVVMAAALATEAGARLLLRRVRSAVSHGARATPAPSPAPPHPEPEETGLEAAEAGEFERSARQRRLTGAISALRRLPFLLGRLLIDLIPIAAFGLAGIALMGTELGAPPITRLVIVTVIRAYVAARLVLALAALLVTPRSARLRLLQVSDWAAAFLTRWTRRITITGLAGYGIAEVGLLFGMYRTAYEALLKLFALVVHACLVLAVLQAREPVARRIHARAGAHGAWPATLNRLADIWHLIAIFYIVALWLVWAVELRNGYVRLVHFFIVTAGVLIASRLIAVVALGGFDRLRIEPGTARHPGLEARMNAYYPLARAFLTGVLAVLTLFTLLEAWGFGVIGWFEYTGLGGRALSAVTLIGVTVLLAMIVWEGANAAWKSTSPASPIPPSSRKPGGSARSSPCCAPSCSAPSSSSSPSWP